MRSRMNRYYYNEDKQKERTKKNQELYDTVYNMEPLKIVGTIDNLNEIDLKEIDDTLKSREEYRKLKEYKKILNQPNDRYDTDYEASEQPENKVYDINSILERAKTERGTNELDDRYRKLKNTQYNILSNLNINDYNSKEKENDSEEQLKDLIHTITMKKMELESIELDEQDDNLLDDLMPTSNTVITEAVNDKLTNKEVEGDIDKSFYSSSYDFTKEDFEDSKKVKSGNKVSKILIRILLFIVIVMVTIAVLFVVNNYLNIEIF